MYFRLSSRVQIVRITTQFCKINPADFGWPAETAIFKSHSNTYLKAMIKTVLLSTLLFILAGSSLQAQDVIRLQQCNNVAIQKQADSLKQLYTREGFQVIKEASITMESEYEMPVIAPLNEGSWYQFVFIGDYSSRLYEVRMYDWDEKQVMYQKKMWGDVDGNIISFSYVPKFSEFHMFKPMQQNKQKKKDLCGYVMLLQRVKPPSQKGA